MNFQLIARFDQQGASALFCVNRSTQSLWRWGGATKDKTVVDDHKEEKKAEEKKTETKVQMETNEELIKARTERDIFKKLYEQMTERLLERRE